MTRFAPLVIRFRWPILASWLVVAAALLITAPFGRAFSEHWVWPAGGRKAATGAASS